MIQIKPEIKKALLDIDFFKRFEQLSKRFDEIKTPRKERLRYFDGEIVMESISRLGYAVEFEPKEKFFIVKGGKIENYSFVVHIILDNGMVDMVWIVKNNDKLILGLPIGEFSRIIFNPDYRIKKPIFGTYEDLDEILCTGFQMFEDFKRVLVSDRTDMMHKP